MDADEPRSTTTISLNRERPLKQEMNKRVS